MARDTEAFLYIPVPVRRGSALHTHLLTEASVEQRRARPYLGSYVADLLQERDKALYGDGAQAGSAWPAGVTPTDMETLVERAVQKALAGVALSSSAGSQASQGPALLADDEEQAIAQEASAYAASWGDDGF